MKRISKKEDHRRWHAEHTTDPRIEVKRMKMAEKDVQLAIAHIITEKSAGLSLTRVLTIRHFCQDITNQAYVPDESTVTGLKCIADYLIDVGNVEFASSILEAINTVDDSIPCDIDSYTKMRREEVEKIRQKLSDLLRKVV